MTSLDRTTFSKVIDLLEPLMSNEVQRRALFTRALVGEAVLSKIRFEGTAQEFTILAVNELVTFGETSHGEPALWALLDTARRQVGADKQRCIDALHNAVNGTSAAPSDERRPVAVRLSYEPEWCPVPAGAFLMGSYSARDPLAYEDELPQHKVDIPYNYCIARYPVTCAQFEPFVQSDGYKKREYWTPQGWRWREENARTRPYAWHASGSVADHPVTGVSWYEAFAYCRWLSKQVGYTVRMPTEAEWEKAARSADGRVYPWGDGFDKSKCNSEESGVGKTTPVGAYSPAGDSPYGCADMAGGVFEWCQSEYRVYPYNPQDGREEIAGREDITRVCKGGSWYGNRLWVRSAARGSVMPYLWDCSLGFRVVFPVLA